MRFIARLLHPEIRAWRRRARAIKAARRQPGTHTGQLIAEQRAFVIEALKHGRG